MWSVVLVLIIGLLAGCGGGGGSNGPTERGSGDHDTGRGTDAGKAVVLPLTSNTGDRFDVTAKSNGFTVTAPGTNAPVAYKRNRYGSITEGSIEEAFWNAGQPKRNDQQVCVTLHSAFSYTSTGAVLRMLAHPKVPHSSGVVVRASSENDGASARAIVISQQMTLNGLWSFVVSTRLSADDGRTVVSASNTLGYLDFSSSVGMARVSEAGNALTSVMQPMPWRMCARVIGTELTVKVWPAKKAEPAWTDKRSAKVFELPDGLVYPGRGGVFESNLVPGETSKFSDFEVTSPY